MSAELQLDARAPGSPWAELSRRMGGDARVLGAFALLYAVLVAGGLAMPEPDGDAFMAWPAAGALLLALWLADRRHWAAILLIQATLEIVVGRTLSQTGTAQLVAATMAHALAGLLGALIVRRLLRGLQGMRVIALLLFAFGGAAGAVLSALLQTAVAAIVAPADLARHALLYCLAELLGTLTTLPVLMSWLVSHRFARLFPALSLAQRIELAAVLLVQVVVITRVFAGVGSGPEHLRFPVMVMPALIYAAFRLPPRWATTLMGGSGLLVLWLVAHGGNPLVIDDPVARVLWIQLGVLIFTLAVVALSVFVAQSHIALEELAASQSRYRSFIEMSSEAVWRVELAEPMSVNLPLAQQIDWLRRHARVVESSASFGRIAGPHAAEDGGWAAAVPWVQMFEAHLDEISRQGYCADDLRFGVTAGGAAHTYLSSFNGVVRDGRLERLWGVARDVTELVDLNAKLLREQELLRSYAQRILTAEESIRRSTAADLHAGIGQELTAMGLVLTVLGRELAPAQRAQLDELRGRLHGVQERTREMISDLSPPGLYDLGLVPALQWLAVYLRTHNRLRVELDCEVEEPALPGELRVLVFKLVRELLRNVTRHAGVDAAQVRLRGDTTRLLVEVRDQGAGFEWDPESLAGPRRGFGLWHIANRVAEVGGQFQVDSAPGRGARFTLQLPLRAAGEQVA